MKNKRLVPPTAGELEVSVFGPGYGESILLHVGAGNWIIVDACLDPVSKQPAALHYLQELNVQAAQAVRLIVATHWHDDHIHGLGTILEACPSAKLAISAALRNKDLLTLAMLYDKPSTLEHSGLDDFIQVFKILKERRKRAARFGAPQLALADKLIYHDQILLNSRAIEAKVFALSPSDAALFQASLAFSRLLTEQTKSRKWIAPPSPNHTSVVLWVEVSNHKILLGSHLEKTADPSTGWSIILNDSNVTLGKAQVFKIPHHGSENAQHPDVWRELLVSEPFAIVTPFNRGRKTLPTPEDVTRILHATSHGYATSQIKQPRLKWRNRIVRDYLEQVTKSIHSLDPEWGQVRLRRAIDQIDDPWYVELFGAARALS